MIVAIIQARMGSTRLPGKCVLRLPSGKTVIEQVIERAKAIPGVGAVAVAMPKEDLQSELFWIAYGRNGGIAADHICLGSADDVMIRYWQCARELMFGGSPPTSIIRITADDSFRDPLWESLVGKEVQRHCYDYAYTVGMPLGINSEAFSIDALAYAVKHATEREHLTNHFLTLGKKAKLAPIRMTMGGENLPARNYSHLRCTLDTPEDWEVIQAIDRAGCKTTEEIIKFLEARNAENRPS